MKKVLKRIAVVLALVIPILGIAVMLLGYWGDIAAWWPDWAKSRWTGFVLIMLYVAIGLYAFWDYNKEDPHSEYGYYKRPGPEVSEKDDWEHGHRKRRGPKWTPFDYAKEKRRPK